MSAASRQGGRARLLLVRELRTQLDRAFKQQRFAVLNALYAGGFKAADFDIKAVRDVLSGTANAIVTPIVDKQRRSYVLGQKAAAERLSIGGSFQLRNPRAEAYVREVGALRVAGINERTRTRIQQIVSKGMKEGMGVDDIARVLRDQGSHGVFSPFRSTRIAWAETGEAYVQANLATTTEQGGQLGLKQEKRWLTAQDDRVDPDCLQAEGDGWIDIAETFSNGLQAPLSHPSCRCDLEYRALD